MSEPKPRNLFILLFGVLLPLITISVESVYRLCATTLFDPLPTWWHVVWVGCVPLGNFLGWLVCRGGGGQTPLPLGVVLGIAIGVAAIYSLYFLPMMPVAILAIPFLGLGLLPLSPFLSFVVAQRLRQRMRPLIVPEGEKRLPGIRLGIGVSLFAFLLLDGREIATRLAMSAAASHAQSTRQQGLAWLRTFGGEDIVLQDCSDNTPKMGRGGLSFFGFRHGLTSAQACVVYFRITGVPAETALVTASRQSDHTSHEAVRDFDIYQGSNIVGQPLRGLSLVHSHIDGTVDANGVVAYIEWTLVVQNTASQEREARAIILLPPGGVVSRVTLWIDGQEREAAFGGREQVRQAYEQVVRRRRDPLLVTTKGKDRILVQCFPIVPNGGEMKIRLGIAVPLQLENRETATFLLPTFIQQNFSFRDEISHDVQLESPTRLRAKPHLQVEWWEPQALYVLRDTVSPEQLAASIVISAERSVAATRAWVRDALYSDDAFISQTIIEHTPERPTRVVLVIDRSRSILAVLTDIADALAVFPDGSELMVLIAGDEAEVVSNGVSSGDSEAIQQIATQLQALESVGGYDNVPTLYQAWRLASEDPGGVLIWIHGPQPEPSPNASLFLACHLHCMATPLYDLAVTSGPNWVQDRLIDQVDLRPIVHAGDIGAALEHLFVGWRAQRPSLELRRERIVKNAPLAESGEASETLPALAQLWARDEVQRLVTAGGEAKKARALQLITHYRVVTPISGAVVLETSQQYADAGLEVPPLPPSVPEPGTLLLFGAGMLLLLWQTAQKKNRRIL
ncbi:MAG: VIT domain-containing protein [Candidatus Binatia bacterium]